MVEQIGAFKLPGQQNQAPTVVKAKWVVESKSWEPLECLAIILSSICSILGNN